MRLIPDGTSLIEAMIAQMQIQLQPGLATRQWRVTETCKALSSSQACMRRSVASRLKASIGLQTSTVADYGALASCCTGAVVIPCLQCLLWLEALACLVFSSDANEERQVTSCWC